MNYYNDNDPRICSWLRELIKGGHLPDGCVDCRPIEEVRPNDLLGYAQCHFFCGIGGWPLTLKNLGLGERRGIWTGSCPCQPFSAAGKCRGAGDCRHLWPVFHSLIKECRPEHVFGEQVARAIGFNWLDGVCADLEAEDYTVGAVVLGAHSVRAPHIRQRLWWVANSRHLRRRDRAEPEGQELDEASGCGKGMVWMDNTKCERLEGLSLAGGIDACHGLRGWISKPSKTGCWTGEWIECRDGKFRFIPAEPSLFPLVNGVSEPVVRLRGYGNAIVPQVAEAFIQAYFECLAES